MRGSKTIQVFEHDRLVVGQEGFKQKHLNALLQLNERHDFSYFYPIYNGIKFKQYVGVIQVNGLCIEILPKSDRGDDDMKWQGVLIQMLKACGRLKPESTGGANVNRQHFNLLEVYFELFLNELEGLIRKGLVKQYRKDSGQVKALKGKLDFAGQIRHNLVHHERFYTTHQVYDHDHLLHQVLSLALDVLGYFTRSSWLFDRYKRVRMGFPQVKEIKVSKSMLDAIKLNRKTAPYDYSLKIARLILLNYSPDVSGGKERMLSLLFDMNKLWEEYLLVMLRKVLVNSDYQVVGQDKKPFWNSNFLQPDIVIRNLKTSDCYIIDTKWKQPGNSGASMSDLRQMYAYSRFWKASKSMLLYPGKPVENDFLPFLDDESENCCKMGFVEVVDEEGVLDRSVGERVLEMLEKCE